MAVDLTNSESAKGALDALKTILKSRQQPIKVKTGTGGGSGGPQLQPPKNIKVEGGEKGNPGNPGEDEENKNGKGNPPGDPGDKNAPKNSPTKDGGEGGSGTPSDGDEQGDQGDGNGDSETPEQRAARIARINDPTSIESDLADIRQDTALRNAEIISKGAKKTTVDDLVKGAATGGLGDFASFSADLFKAISTQVKQAKHKSDTYRRPNPSFAGTPYLMPGKDYLDKKSVPVIGVYFDQSGSWGPDEVKKGIEAISCLHQFEKQRKLKIKLFFFDDHLYDAPEKCTNGGTGGFPEVLAHINNPANKIQNAIILTDSDIERQTKWDKQPVVSVPGAVWYLWKYGSKSKTALKHLKGARGLFQYELR